MIEYWKKIKNYPGYEVSNTERIMGFPHGNIMKSIKRNGTCGGYKWRKEI